MNYYFAPMDGITDFLYRQIVWRHFPYADKLYAPFIQPNEKPVIVPKEYKETCPENNKGIPTVPQILTRDAEGFIRLGEILEDMGYDEINLNLGCPAKLIVAKGKGSGMLSDLYYLEEFLDIIFTHSWKAKITVKTRLGLTDNSEFAELLKVYSKFPIYELTIHPRFKSDYYSGTPRLDEFSKLSSMISDGKCFGLHNTSICYNGDINASDDRDRVVDEFPFISSVMCGRGALANPALFRELKGGQKLTKDEFISFHNDVYDTYKETVAKERYFLHRMQEMWTFWNQYFKFDQELVTTLRRVSNIAEYLEAINNLIDTIPD
ncbi:MAG: tRNA-dihydrouridine synthase family protein [Lachnospiraceae bacterium]|nr:tRNA-dihydrouridine synthase family protein [Lachnospiraceae bacterium]